MNNTLIIPGNVSVEREIKLPYFCKYGETYCKVESPSKRITVVGYPFHMSIQIHDSVNGSLIAVSDECTEDDFLEALYKVSDYIQKQIPVLQ
jgi:hypothetical protein